MASHAFIVAHSNIFNRSALEEDAFYFTTSEDISLLVNKYDDIKNYRSEKIENNIEKINNKYSWETIVIQYENLFERLLNENSNNNSK